MLIKSRPLYGAINAYADQQGRVRFSDDFEKFIDDLMRSDSSVDITIIAASGDTSLTAANQIVEVDASGGEVIITLPTVDDVADGGYQIAVTKVDASQNKVKVQPQGSEQINASDFYYLTQRWSLINLYSNGDRFRIA